MHAILAWLQAGTPAHWQIILGQLVLLAPSILTGMSKVPKLAGWVPAVRFLLSRLSLLHFADVPGTMKAPMRASKLPGDPVDPADAFDPTPPEATAPVCEDPPPPTP